MEINYFFILAQCCFNCFCCPANWGSYICNDVFCVGQHPSVPVRNRVARRNGFEPFWISSFFCGMSDVKQSTLDNIVRGLTKNPRVKTLHKIALAFNMTLAEFLDFKELNEYAFDEDEEE